MPIRDTSSGFTNVTPHAVPRSPRGEVESFLNQNIGQTLAGTPGATGSTSPAQTSVGRARTTPVGIRSGQQQMDQVRLGSQRLAQNVSLVSQARQKRQAAAQQQGMGGPNGVPQGQAWTPDGHLSPSRNQALTKASSYLGSRYQLGGTSYKGIDCSGLVMMVYGQLGIASQHSAGWQGRNIPGVRTAIQNLRPGDIVAWKDGSHIAIYAGNGEIIEAANPRVGTVRRKLWASPNQVYGIALRLPGE